MNKIFAVGNLIFMLGLILEEREKISATLLGVGVALMTIGLFMFE